MGLLIDYFVAASDAEAASAIDDGPEGRFECTDGSGIEPSVNLGMLEELLTGKTFDEQLADPDSRPFVDAGDEDGEVMIQRIGSDFTTAVASTAVEDLQRLAGPWSEIEEFGGMADPDDLADFLVRFRELAIAATSSGSSIYCLVSL